MYRDVVLWTVSGPAYGSTWARERVGSSGSQSGVLGGEEPSSLVSRRREALSVSEMSLLSLSNSEGLRFIVQDEEDGMFLPGPHAIPSPWSMAASGATRALGCPRRELHHKARGQSTPRHVLWGASDRLLLPWTRSMKEGTLTLPLRKHTNTLRRVQ